MEADEEEAGGPYIAASRIRATYGVCNNTLRGLADKGSVRHIRIGAGGKRLYSLPDVRAALGIQIKEKTSSSGIGKPRAKIVYARVSSQKQKEDLARQIQQLSSAYPEHEIVKDIASGINFKRKGLLSILDRAMRGSVEEVVVAHRDRLCRIAFDLVEHVLRQGGVKVVVLDHLQDTESPESDVSELREDLLAIATIFVASSNGKRAARNRRLKAAEEEGQAARTETSQEKTESPTKMGDDQSEEDQALPHQGAEKPVENSL